jgi:multidrug efflux pump
VFTAFVADRSVLALGATIITAQLVSMIFNGFAGLITSLFQATGRALPATVMSMTQGVLLFRSSSSATSGSGCPASSGH